MLEVAQNVARGRKEALNRWRQLGGLSRRAIRHISIYDQLEPMEDGQRVEKAGRKPPGAHVPSITMEVILSLASGIIGAVIATWWTNWSIEQRDRAVRKCYSLGFLEKWKMGFAPEVNGVNSEHYQRTVGGFCREARILQDDFPERADCVFGTRQKGVWLYWRPNG